ncbi:MAG: hypothetical protein DWQ21_07315 [Bacteroidetes bacterium]|nr:MAG: hypothetical protein DWQ21_07315 [Bacteroidota bacterium]REK64294.1 MAG: hypothetical protein DWQ49_01750 [Bacteroidota bacterium]
MNKVLLFTAAGGALLWVSRMLSAKQMSENSVIRILRPRVSKTNLYGLTIALDVAVDNPTNKSVTITSPVITLSSNGAHLASTPPTRNTFRIEALSQSMLNSVEIQLPWTSLVRYAGSMLTKFQELPDGQRTLENLAIPLEYKYTTYVNGVLYESKPERVV